MDDPINVLTGEVKLARANAILKSAAIGSCIVVTALYPSKDIGAMAHIMLPGKAPEGIKDKRFRFAEDAINEMMDLLNVTTEESRNVKICLVGAGNVLKRDDDSICRNITGSVLEILDRKNLNIEARALGGTKRRSVIFNIAKGEVYFTEDGSPEILLWKNSA